MAIEGKLGAGGGADLLVALRSGRRTGILDLRLDGASRKLVLRDGEIVYLTSDVKTEKLPLRIVARGLAPKEAVVEAAKSEQDLRSALAERGLEPERYDAELRSMIADAVRAVFPVREGEFSFVDKADLQLPGILESHDTTLLFWECARSCPPEQAEAFVGPTSARVQRCGEDEVLATLPGLGPQEGFLLSRVDGYGSVEDLCSASPAGREAALSLVFALCCAGFLEVTGRPGVKLPKGATGRKAAGARRPAPSKPAAQAGPSAAEAARAAAAAMEAQPEEERDPLERAKEMLARSKEATHYGVLGVTKDVEQGDVRRAYYALAKTFHPDRFSKDLPEADREVVEDLFARIGEAFRVLNDPEERKEYDEQLASGALEKARKDDAPVDPKEQAKQSYQKGMGLLQMGERGRAVRFLEHAVDRDPDTWDYRLALARLYMSDTRTRRKAEEHLKEAIRINQSRAESYYQLALLYKSANLKTRALEQLELGRKWDADHAGIREELAALQGGGGDKAGSGGLLGGLFGKKE